MTTAESNGYRIGVREAPEWDALFKRCSGWTGSDGIYAVALSGREVPAAAESASERQIFIFGDTFIGEVDGEGVRRDFRMVNNTLAQLDGSVPDPEALRFLWSDEGDGTFFTPSTAQARAAGACWYWLQDGFAQNGYLYMMPMLIARRPDGPPGFQFRDFGTCLIKVPLGDDGPEWALHEQEDVPLFHVNERRKLFFGAAFMPHTEQAGVPDPDGYVYAYGRYHGQGEAEVQLAVARVESSAFEDATAWRFWDGARWSADIADTAPLGRGGPELSVTPAAHGALAGRYLLVSMHVERDLYVRIGDSPVGPFGPRINIYHTTEPDAGKEIYTYNAKAHPTLSTPDEWLVSYNVNARSWDSLVEDADIYRPRFLWVSIERS